MGRKRKIVLKAEAAAKAAGKTVQEIVAENPEEFPPSILEKPQTINASESAPAEPPKEVTPFIQPEAVDGLYDLFGKGLVAAAIRFKGVPPDIAQEAFPFTPSDKETLRKPTAKIINKYAPAWLVKYQDEIALTLMLVTVINAKIQLCNNLAASRRQTETPAPTEIVQ
jgi:hypothetical protein